MDDNDVADLIFMTVLELETERWTHRADDAMRIPDDAPIEIDEKTVEKVRRQMDSGN